MPGNTNIPPRSRDGKSAGTELAVDGRFPAKFCRFFVARAEDRPRRNKCRPESCVPGVPQLPAFCGDNDVDRQTR
jgi:hypothetical protein